MRAVNPFGPVVRALWGARFRGKRRLLDRLVPQRGELRSRVFGYRTTLDVGEEIQRQMYLGVFEPDDTRQLLRRLRPGMTFLDVGANAGYYSLLAASRVGPGGRVVAVEPSWWAVSRLRETKRRNDIAQLDVHEHALGDAAGRAELFLPPSGSRNHSPTMTVDCGGRAESVAVHTLDDRFAAWGVDRVDVMKMDVEGHEQRVLDGGTEVLAAGRVRTVVCEFNEVWLNRAGTSGAELWSRFVDLGFLPEAGPRCPEFGPFDLCNLWFTHPGREGT